MLRVTLWVDRGLDGHSEDLELFVGGLELLEAPETPGHVMQAGLRRIGPSTGGYLEERQVVMRLTDAEEHRA